MATNGKLGSVMSIANTNVTAFDGDANCNFINASIRMVNIGATNASVRLAISTNATPTNQDYLEYNCELVPGGILERTCVTMGPNEKVVAFATTANVAIRVDGLVQN